MWELQLATRKIGGHRVFSKRKDALYFLPLHSMSYVFTSESVTEGHPDKMCDQISDAILDDALKQDPYAHIACECLVTTGLVVVAGEMRTSGYIDIAGIARQTIKEIGYDDAKFGFDHKACAVMVCIGEQSPDIALGVDAITNLSEQQGAGDQGLMFGFACDETPELMPLPISLAHKLTQRLTEMRKTGSFSYLRPDGKSQVSVQYDDSGKPERVAAVVLSTQHEEDVFLEQIREDVQEHVIKPVCGDYLDEKTVYHINPTGRFVIGGPPGDCGLTGRKIIVDTYGGYSRHGGGAFSGKDPSKVDRSAAYAARWVAKHIVKAGLARKAEVQIAYAIGVVEPVSVYIDTFGTGVVSDDHLERAVREIFDLRPASIIRDLDLLRPQYRGLAAYGHMGREDLDVQWEETPRMEELKKIISKSEGVMTGVA